MREGGALVSVLPFLVGFIAGSLIWFSGYLVGHKRGRALCPSDYALRDVARQRDQLVRERDEARMAYAQVVAVLEATKRRPEARSN
jgi:hypothetical protein